MTRSQPVGRRRRVRQPADSLDRSEHRPRLARLGVALVTCGAYFGGWGWLAFAAGLAVLYRAWSVPGEGLRLVGPQLRWELARRTPYRHAARFLAAAGFAWVVIAALQALEYAARSSPAGGRRYSSYGAWGYFQEVHAALDVAAGGVATGLGLALVALAAVLVPMGFAGERANKRVEALLGTALTARELLASRALARMALIAEPLLMTLPFWVVLPQFHSVSLELLRWVLPAVACTAFGVAGVGLRQSFRVKDPLAAVGRTAGVATLYQLLMALPLIAAAGALGVWVSLARYYGWAPPPRELLALYPVVEFPGMANPLVQGMGVGMRVTGWGVAPLDAVTEAVRHYCAGCVGLGLWSFVKASEELRRIDFQRGPGKSRRRFRLRFALAAPAGQRDRLAMLARQERARDRERVWDWPALWWEANRLGAATSSRQRLLRRGLFGLAVGAAVGLLAYLADWVLTVLPARMVDPGLRKGDAARLVLRGAALGLSGVALGVAGVAALLLGATAFARERSGDTYESLCLSDLSGREVLAQKLGGVLAALGQFAPIAAGVLAGLTATGHLSPLTLTGWLLATPGWLAFCALFGLACGVRSTQAGRAVGLTAAVLYGVCWLGSVANDRPWPGMTPQDRVAREVIILAAVPPGALFAAAQPTLWGRYLGLPPARSEYQPTASQFALVYLGGVAVTPAWCYLLWRIALYRLRRDGELARGPAPAPLPRSDA